MPKVIQALLTISLLYVVGSVAVAGMMISLTRGGPDFWWPGIMMFSLTWPYFALRALFRGDFE